MKKKFKNREKANFVDQQSSIFGGKVFILRFLLSEILDFKSLSGFQQITSKTYDELKLDTQNVFFTDKEYGSFPATYNSSSIWKPAGSVDSLEGNVRNLENKIKTYFFFLDVDKCKRTIGSFSGTPVFNNSTLLFQTNKFLFHKRKHSNNENVSRGENSK